MREPRYSLVVPAILNHHHDVDVLGRLLLVVDYKILEEGRGGTARYWHICGTNPNYLKVKGVSV